MTAPPTASLYLVGTPIGNLGDITLRALETLKSVDLIAAEDTRETRHLLTHFAIDKPLVSYHAHNMASAGPRLIARIQAGESIALVTDAGMPGISDPGEDLARLAIAAGVTVIPIPGPTAFVAGLVGSGLPTQRFVFEGFLPREPKQRRRLLRELAFEARTLVFYEAPHRLVDTLTDMAGVWGETRRAVVGRELTKRFETFHRGTLTELVAAFTAAAPRGEAVLMIEGSSEAKPAAEMGDWRPALEQALASGQRASEAAKAIAKQYGATRDEVYEAAVSFRRDAEAPPPD